MPTSCQQDWTVASAVTVQLTSPTAARSPPPRRHGARGRRHHRGRAARASRLGRGHANEQRGLPVWGGAMQMTALRLVGSHRNCEVPAAPEPFSAAAPPFMAGGGSSSAGPHSECSSLPGPWEGLRLGPPAALTGPSPSGEVSSQRTGLRARADWAGEARTPMAGGCPPRRSLEQTHGQRREFNG